MLSSSMLPILQSSFMRVSERRRHSQTTWEHSPRTNATSFLKNTAASSILNISKEATGSCCVMDSNGERNRDYEPLEKFSDLHVTFEDEGMDGFGDFLIVGDDFSESGGPAYAIAIHLTFIDPDKEDEMWIHHFLSDRQDTPKTLPENSPRRLHR